jgi:hypothetical protein
VELASLHAFAEDKDEAAVHVGGENRRCMITITSPSVVSHARASDRREQLSGI